MAEPTCVVYVLEHALDDCYLKHTMGTFVPGAAYVHSGAKVLSMHGIRHQIRWIGHDPDSQ